jgi:FkbM family methyltransferase
VFISYAQNFEDVILWRALKHINNGFYIDIGAQDPVVDSVSRAFYEKGWRGVHAEATLHYADKVRRNRPDELVVQAAIGAGEGSLRFFEIPETGLSTSSHDIAMKHQAEGHKVVETEVPLIPLSVVLAQAGGRDVHWLKIDVEGMEQSVIDSWLPSKIRPWIVVVESTLPNSQIPSHEAWEASLLGLGYTFVYFDGVSRFYVSDEHPELRQVFGPGPNFFDFFVLADTSLFIDTSAATEAQGKLLELKKEMAEKNVRLEANQDELKDFRIQLDQMRTNLDQMRTTNDLADANVAFERSARHAAEAALAAMRSSSSWRITAPLRQLSRFISYLLRGMVAWVFLKPGSRPRRTARTILTHAILWVRQRPHVARKGLALLQLCPPLERRLRQLNVAMRGSLLHVSSSRQSLDHNEDLTPRGVAILADIQNEISKKNK